jgi:hypothetical protein
MELAPDELVVMENLLRCWVLDGRDVRDQRELIARAMQREQRTEWVAWLSDLRRRSMGVRSLTGEKNEPTTSRDAMGPGGLDIHSDASGIQ